MSEGLYTNGREGVPTPFRVLERNIYKGPNLYSRLPMIRMRVDLGSLENWPSNRIMAFNDRLLGLLPGLRRHGCSCPDAGGFPARLAQGTWIGHIIEHVALELQVLAGSAVSRGKTRSVAGQRGVYDILFRYQDEALGIAAGSAAVRLVLSLLPKELKAWRGNKLLAPPLVEAPQDVAALIPALSNIRARSALGPTTNALVQAAQRRGIPSFRLDRQSKIQLGFGIRQQCLRASITGKTSQIAVGLAADKERTKAILAELGMPVPAGVVVRTVEEALAFAQKLKVPIVIKPLDGNHGRGVTTDIATEAQIQVAFSAANAISSHVIIEQHLPGRDHRILVVDGKVVAVAERAPASIVGDGFHTIQQLIDLLNADERRGHGHEKTLTRIKIDGALQNMLERQNRQLDSIPNAGEMVLLRGTGNLSSGGTATDRTDEIHPHNKLIAEMAARAIGLDIAGVDFISPDISRPVSQTGGGIVEINAAPGFRMHLAPSAGSAQDVAMPVIDMLFPRGTHSRIPIVAVTGTNGKSTTVRMITAILQTAGQCVGMTNTSGVYVDDMLLKAGDASGPRSARMILRNPAVEAAVLETARGGILREGLGFDTCSVGIVLNVSEDHLGRHGIDTLQELAAVKSVIVTSVARKGTTILNLDDTFTRAMARKARSKIIWFSLNATPADVVLAAHLDAGGAAALYENIAGEGHLVVYCGRLRMPIMRASDIPATAKGAASFNIANALAAIAAGFALHIDVEIMARALHRFTSSYRDNPGRFNIIDNHSFRVIIDYAHNPASLTAVGESLQNMRPLAGRTIGMVSTPGDRRDCDIREIGRIAAGMFDQIIFREGPDGRGRPRGEVLALLEEGAKNAGGAAIQCESILEERDAVAHCLSIAQPGDLLVLFPTCIDAVYRQVKTFVPVWECARGSA